MRNFAEKVIADFDITYKRIEAQVRSMSGGNLQKVVLGRSFPATPKC